METWPPLFRGTFVLFTLRVIVGYKRGLHHPATAPRYRTPVGDDHCSPSRHEIAEVHRGGKKKKGKKAKKKEGKGGGESEGTDRFIVCNRERVEARRPIRFSRFFHQTKMIPRRADNARENTRLEIEGTQNIRIHNNLFAASAFCLLSALESRPSLRRGSLMQNSRVIRGYMFKNPCVSPRPCARLPQSLPVQPVSQRIL